MVKKFKVNLKEYNLIAVLHIVPDILDFIKCLKKIFKEVKIIPKSKSLSKKIKSKIPKNILLELKREDLKKLKF